MSDSSPLFVQPGHFYSPIPARDEAEYAAFRYRQTRSSPLPGVRLDLEEMAALWEALEPAMLSCPLPAQKASSHRYYFDNDFFSYGDGLIYFAMLDRHRPRAVVEIGSGFSSALLLDAREHLRLDTEVTFIEPYPTVLRDLLSDTDRSEVELIVSKIQGVDPAVFDRLGAGDILFIDSSHVAKCGSDVTVEIFDILPRLHPGVIVHFHDVFDGFEYPETWIIGQNRGWNEAYFLRAFLMYNDQFRVEFFNDFFFRARPDVCSASACGFARNPGGSLWLVRQGSSNGTDRSGD